MLSGFAWTLRLFCALGPERAVVDSTEVDAVHPQIVSGVIDAGDDAVVAIVREGQAYCTGTLIAPRVVVTAAHCIERVRPDSVFFGTATGGQGTLISVIDTRIDPEFDLIALTHDVGMLLLNGAAPAAPWPLLRMPFDPSLVGRRVRVVGFGQAFDGAPPRKREGFAVIDSYTTADFRIRPGPSLPCAGDSGGPAFLALNGVEYLAGLTSSGDSGCERSANETRVDVVGPQFLEPYLAATTEGAAALGQRCYYDANCTTGSCLFPGDAPSFGYCSRGCNGASDCPSGMVCAQSEAAPQCRHPLPSPGALGASCVLHSDCEEGLCARSSAVQSRRCARLCFPGDECSSGQHCAPNIDRSGTYACFVDHTEGCSLFATTEFPGIPGAVVLLWLCRRARSIPAGVRKRSLNFR